MVSNQSFCHFAMALLLISFVFSPAGLGAKVEKRVVFAKGKTSATYAGKLPPYAADYDAYFFRARAKQRLSIKLTTTDPDAYLAVFETKTLGPAEDTILANDKKSREWSGDLPISSEYSVQVYSTSSDRKSSGAAYTIEISLR
jgi:hypothetical protein